MAFGTIDDPATPALSQKCPPDKLGINLDGHWHNLAVWVEQVNAKTGETSICKAKEEKEGRRERQTKRGQEKQAS